MFKQIIYGLLGIIGSLILTVKAHKIVDNTGRIQWAERVLGGAGTYTFVRLLGIFLSLFFFLYMFGLVGIVYKEIVDFIYSLFGIA